MSTLLSGISHIHILTGQFTFWHGPAKLPDFAGPCALASFLERLAMAGLNDGLWAWQQPGNNNKLIDLQHQRRDPATPGDVKFEFFGCMAFRITTPAGVSIFIDPWRNGPAGGDGQFFRFEMPSFETDIGISTHAHFDHDALHLLQSGMLLDRLVGRFEFADLTIEGIADKHVCDYSGCLFNFNDYLLDRGVNPFPPNNTRGYDNTLVIINTGGLRILHWGDNRPNPPREVWDAIGEVDVIILPIDDSRHVLTKAQANETIARVKAKIAIPCHYFTRGLFRVVSTMLTADEWVSQRPSVTHLESGDVTLNPDALAGKLGHTLYFGQHLAFPLPEGSIRSADQVLV